MIHIPRDLKKKKIPKTANKQPIHGFDYEEKKYQIW